MSRQSVPAVPEENKEPFDIHRAITVVREAVRPFPKAALFALYDEGYTTPFEQLIACVISVRTRDETMLTCARALFALARTPQQVVELAPEQIGTAIADSTFHDVKVHTILGIARRVVEEFGSVLPCDYDTLVSLHGVGPKCANLVLGIACGIAAIGVDIHVHRVTNRWGYVQASTPEKTMRVLQQHLPREYFVEINRLLVPFGKHLCTGTLPRCSVCPVLPMCRQIGVAQHR